MIINLVPLHNFNGFKFLRSILSTLLQYEFVRKCMPGEPKELRHSIGYFIRTHSGSQLNNSTFLQLECLERSSGLLHEQFHFLVLELLFHRVTHSLELLVNIWVNFVNEIIQCLDLNSTALGKADFYFSIH